MAAVITVEDVLAVQPSTLPEAVIESMIALVDQADACLDANGVPDDVQSLIKIYGVSHLLAAAQSGNLLSERSPTGASQSYRESKNPLHYSKWGQQLSLIDQYGCVTSLIQGAPKCYLASVGPGGRRGTIYERSGR